MQILRGFLVLATCLTLGLPTWSQTPDNDAPPQPGARGQHRNGGGGNKRQMLKQLGLSKEQMAQMKSIRASTPAGPERRKAMMSVLTPDQRARLMAAMGKHRGQAGPGRERRGPEEQTGGPP